MIITIVIHHHHEDDHLDIEVVSSMAVCDETKNLNETESETFFRYQFFPILNPILFSISNFFATESETNQKIEKFRNREDSKPKRHTLVVDEQYSPLCMLE